MVLRCLNTSLFEPLHLCSLRNLTKKVLFLVALATAKRVGELQAISRTVSFVSSDACLMFLSSLPRQSFSNPLPCSFLVKSLSDFAAGLEEDLVLCPVRALRIYLHRTDFLSPLPRRLFVSPRHPSRSLSKNAISFFFLWEVIHDAGASRLEVGSVRAHSIGYLNLRGFPSQLVGLQCVRGGYLEDQFGVCLFLPSGFATRI